eukprot:TRINITY_DN4278_c0_g3_i2.p1 TRINITY_DN4278_c0_g3~~TRINITY_DN4278_c0_g3_i2.p1  ORF type:complete len:189 (+),score=43.22 TRINITY_DN4278_c0_g3_i2:110-676(+)
MSSQNTMKIVMLGENGTGKSCIISRYMDNTFRSLEPTEYANFKTKTLASPNGNCEIKQVVWDTAGQEIYRSLAPFYYRDADGVVLVYSVTDEKSFKELKYWVGEVQLNSKKDVLMTVVGNKSDLVDEETVSEVEASEFAKAHEASFFLVSAKENINVTEMFTELGLRRFPSMRKAFGYKKTEYFRLTV